MRQFVSLWTPYTSKEVSDRCLFLRFYYYFNGRFQTLVTWKILWVTLIFLCQKLIFWVYKKSQSERKWPVNFCLSVISVSISDKGTDVPAATCLFIVITGHCSINSAICHTWIMKSANFLWYSSMHSWHCQLMIMKIVHFPLGRRTYYEIKRRQKERGIDRPWSLPLPTVKFWSCHLHPHIVITKM